MMESVTLNTIFWCSLTLVKKPKMACMPIIAIIVNIGDCFNNCENGFVTTLN